MHTISLVLVYLACVGHGRCVNVDTKSSKPAENSQNKGKVDPLTEFATLLLALNPAVAFVPSSSAPCFEMHRSELGTHGRALRKPLMLAKDDKAMDAGEHPSLPNIASCSRRAAMAALIGASMALPVKTSADPRVPVSVWIEDLVGVKEKFNATYYEKSKYKSATDACSDLPDDERTQADRARVRVFADYMTGIGQQNVRQPEGTTIEDDQDYYVQVTLGEIEDLKKQGRIIVCGNTGELLAVGQRIVPKIPVEEAQDMTARLVAEQKAKAAEQRAREYKDPEEEYFQYLKENREDAMRKNQGRKQVFRNIFRLPNIADLEDQ